MDKLSRETHLSHMNTKALIPSITLGLFLLTSAFAEPAENKASTKNEQPVEKKAEPEEGRNWIERLFGSGKDKAEQKKSASGKAEETAKDANKSAAQARGKAKDKPARGFSDNERAVLEDWQRGEAGWKKSGRRLPPGLQKKVDRGDELPPGWKKKLAVGEKLPEEYEAQAQSLPEEILKRLPETVEGTEILQIGDEVIRVLANTREIVDILGIGQSRAAD
ncbi:MAG: hypothetical protein ACNA77_02055 [Opitutales bacterium]